MDIKDKKWNDDSRIVNVGYNIENNLRIRARMIVIVATMYDDGERGGECPMLLVVCLYMDNTKTEIWVGCWGWGWWNRYCRWLMRATKWMKLKCCCYVCIEIHKWIISSVCSWKRNEHPWPTLWPLPIFQIRLVKYLCLAIFLNQMYTFKKQMYFIIIFFNGPDTFDTCFCLVFCCLINQQQYQAEVP